MLRQTKTGPTISTIAAYLNTSRTNVANAAKSLGIKINKNYRGLAIPFTKEEAKRIILYIRKRQGDKIIKNLHQLKTVNKPNSNDDDSKQNEN